MVSAPFGMRVFLRFVCVPLCFCEDQKVEMEGLHHLLNEFLRLRSFNALIRSWHVSREVMLNCFNILLSFVR